MDTKNCLFEIIIGTYEKFLIGYYLELHTDEFCLKPSFVTESHVQSVRCLASSGKFLASGSTDETIQLFNIKSRHEIGSLVHHNGTVSSLEFFDSFLMSCSEDKTICVWSTSSWQCLKTLCGHKKAVKSISIHPSGKMALSVSKDLTLRTWNLIKGRSAFVTNLKNEAEFVRWTPDGSHFVVVYKNSIDVYSVEDASVLHSINFQHTICDLTFVKDTVCAVAGDSDNIHFCDIATCAICYQQKAHKTRIKAVKSIKVNDDLFLTTASSDGQIKVWHVDTSDFTMKRVAKVKTGSRPTCMTVTLIQS